MGEVDDQGPDYVFKSTPSSRLSPRDGLKRLVFRVCLSLLPGSTLSKISRLLGLIGPSSSPEFILESPISSNDHQNLCY
jgi:hypothetical protein